ncbi:hypothetical protein J3R83DRAFT_4307 [Lanmaoa asiatica]|nr:hypothetical protein J3R83DRAFT_4307 [Lanmaoa asiatica]
MIKDSLDALDVLAIASSLELDDYATSLSFLQKGVTAITDQTALYLIGAVTAPVAQDLVNGAVLAFPEANITCGSLTNVGPLDALIEFVDPVMEMKLQPFRFLLSVLPPTLVFQIMPRTEHWSLPTRHNSTYLLHNPSFDWTISTSSLRVTALGTIFDNVSLTKTITLKAFNNLPGVTISNFQLPSDDPAGGITISTDSLIPSPAQLGIDLGTVTFQAYFDNTLVGRELFYLLTLMHNLRDGSLALTATDLVLPPEGQVTSHLAGRMIPQSGNGLNVIGQLFSEYLAADNITLSVTGESVQPTGASSPVTWLSDAFQTLSLAVTLPGQKFNVNQSIALTDLSLIMETQQEAFAPLSGSNNTVAEYKNPFGFSLQVVQSAVNMTLGAGGVSAASLNLPSSNTVGGVSTGNSASLPINFHNVPLVSLNDAAFEAMFAEVTDKSSATFHLSGTADVTAKTSIGDVPISGIPFDVSSTLQGINSFGGTAAINNVSITGSGGTNGDQYIISPLTTVMNNPSNVLLSTVDIALPVYYENVMIGRAAFNFCPRRSIWCPAKNTMAGEFQYEPTYANDTVAESFLTSFVQSGNVLSLTVQGDSVSSPFTSLNPALEGVTLHTSVTGLNVPPIITHLYATISLVSLVNEVQLSFDIHNPLEADLVIEFVQADGLINGEIYAHFDQAFSNFVIPPGQTVNSGTFSNVVLTQGALASLGIIPLEYMDVQSVATARCMHVTADYNLGLLSLGDLSSAVQSMTASTSPPSTSSSSLSSTSSATTLSSSSVQAAIPSPSAGNSTHS